MVISGYSDCSTNKTDRHDINEILLKVVLNTITLNPYLIFIDIFPVALGACVAECKFVTSEHKPNTTDMG